MRFPYGETVIRQRGTAAANPYSGENTEVDWDAPGTLMIGGCGIADGGSVEPLQDARNAVESDFDVLAPYGVDVLAGDRVVIRGLVCEVVGRPFRWRNPFTGTEFGTLVRAKLVEG